MTNKDDTTKTNPNSNTHIEMEMENVTCSAHGENMDKNFERVGNERTISSKSMTLLSQVQSTFQANCSNEILIKAADKVLKMAGPTISLAPHLKCFALKRRKVPD